MNIKILKAEISPSILGDVPYIQSTVKLDGVLDEAVWSQALEVPMTFEISPGENILAPVKTKALLFEDGENLYIAFEAKDKNPKLIRAYLSDRDDISASDQVSIKLDTFNDSRKAFQFEVNPLGIQSDSIIDEQTNDVDKSWDAIWYSAGMINQQGFNVEIKLPFNALRFEKKDGIKSWGLEVNRKWGRKVTHNISNQTVDRDINCDLCQMGKVKGFKNVKEPKNFTLIPSLTLLNSDKRNLGESWQSGDIEKRTSLDFRWGIARSTYLNATINPDFSQVEADAIQLDINNLSTLRLTEKRSFFQDGADYFSNWSRLVYTRIFEEPDYGVKVTGKQDGHSYGIMSLEDKHTQLVVPNEYRTQLVKLTDKKSNNQIFRYRYDLGDTGNIGSTMAVRNADGYHNQVLGVDGKFWFGESDYVKFQLFDSKSDYSEEVITNAEFKLGEKTNISDHAYSVNYTHNDRDWSWFTTFHRFGKDFRADTGFISFANWKRLAVGGSRTWYSETKNSWWKTFNIYSDWIVSEQIDGTALDKGNHLNFEVNAIYQSAFGLDLSNTKQTYLGSTFDINRYNLWGEFRPFANLGVNIEYVWKDDIDFSTISLAKVNTLNSSFDYQLTRQLNAEIEYLNESFEVLNSNVYEEVDIVNLRLAYQIDLNSFIRLTVQAQETNKTEKLEEKYLASQLIYSYKLNPYTLFYAGYSDRYKNGVERINLSQVDKTLFMKFSYAWQL